MSKLDSLVDKLADALLPKIRKMIREELDYKFDSMTGAPQARQPQQRNESHQPTTNNPPQGGPNFSKHMADFSGVAESFKMPNENIIVDDAGNQIDTNQLLQQNPKAQKMIESIGSKDYSHLID